MKLKHEFQDSDVSLGTLQGLFDFLGKGGVVALLLAEPLHCRFHPLDGCPGVLELSSPQMRGGAGRVDLHAKRQVLHRAEVQDGLHSQDAELDKLHDGGEMRVNQRFEGDFEEHLHAVEDEVGHPEVLLLWGLQKNEEALLDLAADTHDPLHGLRRSHERVSEAQRCKISFCFREAEPRPLLNRQNSNLRDQGEQVVPEQRERPSGHDGGRNGRQGLVRIHVWTETVPPAGPRDVSTLKLPLGSSLRSVCELRNSQKTREELSVQTLQDVLALESGGNSAVFYSALLEDLTSRMKSWSFGYPVSPLDDDTEL
eukprot:scaffold731_cov261-Pinguiococcus_pyrenoidosus.AAC.96